MTRPCPCMTTSIIIKIARVISMWTPHWITVSCHGVEGPMTSGYYCAIFPFCGGGKKKRKKRRQKNKGILWLGYHRYPSKKTTKKQGRFMTGLPQVSQKKRVIEGRNLILIVNHTPDIYFASNCQGLLKMLSIRLDSTRIERLVSVKADPSYHK